MFRGNIIVHSNILRLHLLSHTLLHYHYDLQVSVYTIHTPNSRVIPCVLNACIDTEFILPRAVH